MICLKSYSVGEKNTPHSEMCTCGGLEGIGGLSEEMLPREKDDCRGEPEIIGHCLTLSHVFKNAREKKIPQMNPLCRNYGN